MKSNQFEQKNTTRLLRILIYRMFFYSILSCCFLFGMNCKKKTASQNTPSPAALPSVSNSIPTEKIQIGEKVFTVELAYTRQTRELGLMYRSSLADNQGMLFIFDNPKVQYFHMNNCLIDLDILFLNEAGKIVYQTTMTAPPVGRPSQIYSSKAPVKYALELPKGTIKKLNLKIDQAIPLPERIKNIIPE